MTEYRFAVGLVHRIHSALVTVTKLIRATSTNNASTLDVGDPRSALSVADSLATQQTPEEWLRDWDGPEEPVAYLGAVMARAVAVRSMHNRLNGAPGQRLTLSSVDLADLFHPDTLLNAFRQQVGFLSFAGLLLGLTTTEGPKKLP